MAASLPSVLNIHLNMNPVQPIRLKPTHDVSQDFSCLSHSHRPLLFLPYLNTTSTSTDLIIFSTDGFFVLKYMYLQREYYMTTVNEKPVTLVINRR